MYVYNAAVAQWVRTFAQQAGGCMIEFKLRQTLVVRKHIVTPPLLKARQQVCVLGDDHYKRMPHATVGVTR